ncbi:MAG TPA: hypothetical protein VNO21_00965 [Polyangiaceae bacterium]|nr:hypothetical protein [Polyangiaceae bacterium]
MYGSVNEFGSVIDWITGRIDAAIVDCIDARVGRCSICVALRATSAIRL